MTPTVRAVQGDIDMDPANGATVEIAGEVRQPLLVIAENLEVLPSARILAPLE